MPLPHINPQRVRWAALALTLATTPSCRSSGPAVSPSSGTIGIGIGAIPGKPGYESVVRGLELAVERLNEGGATRFRLRHPDKGSTSAVRIAQQLRNDPSVLGVVGHPESGNSIETVPVYADAENGGRDAVVAISPTASSPRLSGISPWFFRVAPSDDDAARYVARWVLDSLGAQFDAICQVRGLDVVSRNADRRCPGVDTDDP